MNIHRTKINVPWEHQQPTNYLAKYVRWFGFFILGLLCYAVFMIAILEFAVGCGETTYYADRTWTTNDCIFIPYEPVSGTW